MFHKVASDGGGTPIYAITSKASGNVLSVNSDTVAASDRDIGNPSHHWRITPLCNRYFALQNVDTGRYLDYDNATLGARSGQLGPHNAQCWELVSHRHSNFDFFFLDDDILE